MVVKTFFTFYWSSLNFERKKRVYLEQIQKAFTLILFVLVETGDA